jgi:hypothetical protein
MRLEGTPVLTPAFSSPKSAAEEEGEGTADMSAETTPLSQNGQFQTFSAATKKRKQGV